MSPEGSATALYSMTCHERPQFHWTCPDPASGHPSLPQHASVSQAAARDKQAVSIRGNVPFICSPPIFTPFVGPAGACTGGREAAVTEGDMVVGIVLVDEVWTSLSCCDCGPLGPGAIIGYTTGKSAKPAGASELSFEIVRTKD